MTNSAARILIVDDERQMRRTLLRMLHHLGYANVDENDGKTVMDKALLCQYDLLICDWQMQPHTGLDVLQFVRGDPGLKNLPFIMLTGESGEEKVVTAAVTGANDYIVKPFSNHTLSTKVERVLAAR